MAGESPTDLFHHIFVGVVDATTLQNLRSALNSRPIGGIVVGWPLDPNGQLTDECKRTTAFITQVKAAGILTPIVLWDERGSTALARSILRDSSPLSRRATSARKHVVPHELREKVDELAAVNILESFLKHVRNLGQK